MARVIVPESEKPERGADYEHPVTSPIAHPVRQCNGGAERDAVERLLVGRGHDRP